MQRTTMPHIRIPDLQNPHKHALPARSPHYFMKKHLPNALTCCNLIAGCIATHFALQGHFQWAMVAILTGAVFDFFDGFAARLLHVASPIGKEIDSLADDITFGFAPAAVVFSLLRATVPATGMTGTAATLLPYVAFLIAAFSALRLAKFNLDERQSTTFIGLPTPANALFWAACALEIESHQPLSASWIVPALCLGILLSCFLLVSEIPMFALKFKHYGWAENRLRYTFALFSIAMLAVCGLSAFAWIIPLYIICSVVNNVFMCPKV